ncbi:MAG: hypothetical protein ACI9MR_002567 [Myxococcota bacterium]|jgi:hypothetical protein
MLRHALCRLLAVILVPLGVLIPAESEASPPTATDVLGRAPTPDVLRARLARYLPVELTASQGALSPELAPLLPHLRAASDAIDEVFWDQVSADGHRIRIALAASEEPGAAELASLMDVSYGPWDRHADDRPLFGRRPRPPGANFYPADMTRRELDTWLKKHPADAATFRSPYTVIRRKGDHLRAVPFSNAYLAPLKRSADSLRKAAAAYQCSEAEEKAGGCPCAPLVRFLRARADALTSDRYRDSEVAWLAASTCPLDIVIGPYEYYEDRLMGLKTAFEAMITLRDDAATKHVRELTAQAADLVATLPISEASRARFARVQGAGQITLANLIYAAGDARAGYQLRAYLLPNDEVVREAHGQKKVILHNVVKAKFNALIRPLAARVLTKRSQKNLSSDAYLDLLIAWELGHGLVPGPILLADGTTTTARRQLRERYTVIEAFEGEMMALWNYLQLAKRGLISDPGGKKVAATYLATLLDGARIADSEPQAIAKTMIYNALMDRWVFRYEPATQVFEANADHLEPALKGLLAETLEVMVRGDYDGAGRLIVQYGIVSGEVRQKLSTLGDLPLDIRPEFAGESTSAAK